jgi:hypothetical protein
VIELNQIICPGCGHVMLTDAAYTTCDGCQLFFYASNSADCTLMTQPATPIVRLTIDGVQVYQWLCSGLGKGTSG